VNISEMKALLAAAEAFARDAHAGQVDKAGELYITHPERVAARVDGTIEKAVAWLHDVIEDTDIDLSDLPFPADVVAAVDAMTRRPGELLDDYISRVRANPIAVAVKRADVADNSSPQRLERLDEKTRERLVRKYARTRALLNGVA
jgi:(p)ppGpp synthase/HD superfamily hydrolase